MIQRYFGLISIVLLFQSNLAEECVDDPNFIYKKKQCVDYHGTNVRQSRIERFCSTKLRGTNEIVGDYCKLLCGNCPTSDPSSTPSSVPSKSMLPSTAPTSSPSGSIEPSSAPSSQPSNSSFPSASPTLSPSDSVQPSISPSSSPTKSMIPSISPSSSPSDSVNPSISTTSPPSVSMYPSTAPSSSPSGSISPSRSPSSLPSNSMYPSRSPSSSPSGSIDPSMSPSSPPSVSMYPSTAPSTSPSGSIDPSIVPSSPPSTSTYPSRSPSSSPSGSIDPSISPSPPPSVSMYPSTSPSTSPSGSIDPSIVPSSPPSTSTYPSRPPSSSPSVSIDPSVSPSSLPSIYPSRTPSSIPSSSVVPSHMPTPLLESNCPDFLVNGDFETGNLSGWSKLDSMTELNIIDSSPNGNGNYAVHISNREKNWAGMQQYITDVVEEGMTYEMSVWARLVGTLDNVTQPLRLTMQQIDDSGVKYFNAISSETLTNEWQQFFGALAIVVNGTLSSLRLSVSGPAIGFELEVDNFEINCPPPLPEYKVSAANNSAHVVIPEPPDDATLYLPRTNCPHIDENDNIFEDLEFWETLFPNPTEGDPINIPANTKVIVSSSIATNLGLVTIPLSSELIFGENSDGIKMNVKGIEVEGKLTAGSESCRLETPLEITLHGSRPSDIVTNAKPVNYKGISVTGTLQLHGKRYFPSWTRLAKRAKTGDDCLYLQHPVNWEPGQEIVLITTALRDARDWHENEVFTIQSVDLNPSEPEFGSIVCLNSTVMHAHIATPNYQAEVGLLSRMITIQGAEDDSEPTDKDPFTCVDRSVFGYSGVPCPDKELTGFGGHIMVHSGGLGYVEGVELYRMGQTNVLGRYPIHFHILGNNCTGCYFKASSVHRSFYRCISIHGTHNTTVTENVGFDVIGYCYYLEDGIEEDNTLSFNLAAHIHFIGSPAIGSGQLVTPVAQSDTLTLPADITASGFYITNMHNNVYGNAASGGWAGFAFPVLQKPVGPHKDLDFNPSSRTNLEIDGNTAHSTAWWWGHAAAFYFGGSLYFEGSAGSEYLVYNAGRDQAKGNRNPCAVDPESGSCVEAWNRITNSKIFLVPNVGIGSWSGRMEVVDYEVHDTGLALEALVAGFWINRMFAVCRTGEYLKMPYQRANYLKGDGFFWYDTGQEHIITESTFTNCGYRSTQYNQYDNSTTRGCNSNPFSGCGSTSTVFGFLTHSDQFTPELMQATKDITFNDVGRRFRFTETRVSTVSGLGQNWLDYDGTVSGLGEPTLIGSGLREAGRWWLVDEYVVQDNQAPLTFIKKNDGPARGLAHMRIEWDDALHSKVGSEVCVNGRNIDWDTGVDNGPYCPPVGRIRHVGPRFNSSADQFGGLPVTANPDIAGPAGGYGWLLRLNDGAPHTLKIMQVEVSPETPLTLSIAYPTNTNFTITAKAASWCSSSCTVSCEEVYTEVSTVDEVRSSIGNVYHFDTNTGLLTVRVIMYPQTFTGEPDWKLWNFNDVERNGQGYALRRFERNDVLLPQAAYYHAYIEIAADCNRNGAYCSETPQTDVDPPTCTPGFDQKSYDTCCDEQNSTNCVYAYIPPPSNTDAPSSSPTVSAADIIENGDFEEGICPWNGKNIELIEGVDNCYSGEGCVKTSGRTATWQGIEQNVMEKIETDVLYDFRAYVKLSVTDRLMVKLKVLETDGTWRYHTVSYTSSIEADIWTEISSQFTLSVNYEFINAILYFEGPANDVDFLVDDVMMEAK